MAVAQGNRDNPIHFGAVFYVLIAFPRHVVRRIANPKDRIEQQLY